MSIEHHFSETPAARLSAREKQSQQHFRPVISVHKWFARRPGTLFRALALAELVDRRSDRALTEGHQLHGVCLDPFMGGGTPLIEASRLGLSVVGFDTNPMARWIVERELEDLDPDALAAAGERVLAKVSRRIEPLYATDCPDCGQSVPVRYFIWARQHRCVCGREHSLLADTLLVSAKMGRHPREVHLCPGCFAVSEHAPGTRPACCGRCGEDYCTRLVPARALIACECGEPYRIPPQGQVETPSHRLAAVQYHCSACAQGTRGRRFFKEASAADQALYRRAQRAGGRAKSQFWPARDELIPRGEETVRLLRWGYNAWIDLFGARQLHGLGMLAQAISEEADPRLRHALATCLSDLLRYQNVLCRYDRQALKPADIFAVHGFPVPRVFCEPHLLGAPGEGSGGFRHILAKYVRAKRWCREPYETVLTAGGKLKRVSTVPERVAADITDRPGAGATLRCASIGEDELAENSVDLVLTDPPYFANVRYAQLTDFSYAWLRRLAADTPYFAPTSTKTDQDAVGGGDVDMVEFARRLSEVFTRSARALKPAGPFCFTYHHNELAAYAPVVMACLDAGLVPVRAYACATEMRASMHIHGNQAATTDAVFMLRKPPLPADAIPGEFGARWLGARLAALENAGVKATAADRACLAHTGRALRAMLSLAEGWDAGAPAAERFARAFAALTPERRVAAARA